MTTDWEEQWEASGLPELGYDDAEDLASIAAELRELRREAELLRTRLDVALGVG